MKFCYSLYPLGDNAVIIQLGEDISVDIQRTVQKITSYFEQYPQEWMIEYIPAFTTVAIFYDPLKIRIPSRSPLLPYDIVCQELHGILTELQVEETAEKRVVVIPVCYGGKLGPDLAFIARHNHLTIEEVIKIHTNGTYLVHMIGFAPGFPYIGGMSEKIAAPRRDTPRLRVPAGSVGIAGKQTGIYSLETPGGWQIIGRTPMKLFRPSDVQPSLLQAGDHVKFKPISLNEYLVLEEKMP